MFDRIVYVFDNEDKNTLEKAGLILLGEYTNLPLYIFYLDESSRDVLESINEYMLSNTLMFDGTKIQFN